MDDISIGEYQLNGLRQGDYVTKDSNIISFVNISTIGSEHGGEWTCIARSEVGQISYSSKLIVNGSPFVRQMPNRTLVTHQDLKLKCSVGGNVEEISWDKSKFILS